jgi:glycosyltransferase involved in cell wall biosynthesis
MDRDTQLLKIIHVSTIDISGGAARSAYRLHKSLLDQGYDSTMFVAHRHSSDTSVTAFTPSRDLQKRLLRFFRQIVSALRWHDYQNSKVFTYEDFNDDRSQYGAEVLEQMGRHDLINLHWIAGFIDYKNFFTKVTEKSPIVWRLSDLNPMTGGCHYDNGCGRYRDRCGACPQLNSDKSKDLSFRTWQRKKTIFCRLKPRQLHIVAQSYWMAKEVSGSPLLSRFPVKVIPNGCDTSVFYPRDRIQARAAFEIPQDALVLLFVADSVVRSERKGFELLSKVLSGLGGMAKLYLVSLGKGEPSLSVDIPHLHLGHISNDRLLSLVYSAADVYVIPSVQDNFPNTVLESLACGTPIVGFGVGGIPDMVRPGITGSLATPGDVDALRSEIVTLLEDSATREDMSSNCRRIALEEYTLEIQTKRYIELYREILANGKG